MNSEIPTIEERQSWYTGTYDTINIGHCTDGRTTVVTDMDLDAYKKFILSEYQRLKD
jgi:hypothetical protein